VDGSECSSILRQPDGSRLEGVGLWAGLQLRG
jgi:hypothetical protein